MASVPKSQYDDLQKRHENMRASREREQRRCSKLESELAEVKAQRDRLADTLRNIKMSVCGEAAPNWAASWETTVSRGGIADWCDEALAAIGEKT